MSNDDADPSSSRSPARSLAKRRLSLSALCNPSPSQPTMLAASPVLRPSSSRIDGLDADLHPPPKSLSLSTDDENVMIAVRALDDMRSGTKPSPSPSSSSPPYRNGTPPDQTPSLTTASTSSTPSNASQSLAISSEEAAASADFVSRVTGLPIVNTALRAYEHSKASSRMVKYGAEMMESSVKSISKPVINRLPVNQIDEFACRQLDRFGKYGNSGTSPEARERSLSIEHNWDSRDSGQSVGEVRQSRAKFSIGDRDQSEVPSQDVTTVGADDNTLPLQEANRSRWHSLLYEAGGISAAVSEESMRRLKYCLHWLQYATEHTDGQILVLRNFIASLNAQEEEGRGERPISASHMQTLTNVKRDVVGTIRQVVDVVSKYAGGALPEPARARVRQFILHLPQRWANTAHRQAHVPSHAHSPGQSKGAGKRRRRDGSFPVSGPASAASTAPPSPSQSPKLLGHATLPLSNVAAGSSYNSSYRQATLSRPTAGSAAQAAQRVLTLATESLDMMRSVTGVFKESLDRADTWVDRLRIIGIQRQQNPDSYPDDFPPPPHSRESTTDSPSTSTISCSVSRSGSATASYTSFPPSPRSWPADAPSPGGLAAASLNALTLSSLSANASAFATPRSSTQSLPTLADYDWEYTARKLQTIRDADERLSGSEGSEGREGKAESDEQSAASALSALRRSTSSRDASMEVDDKE
ncbi:hypothetical protein M0805_005107 [Coniferiporia weirii]|nr:hypothetical protein M0805_005107 [Coniferiporia weirii]